MMSTELKYYCMNNFIYWFEIAIPNVFTPLQCRYNQLQFVSLHVTILNLSLLGPRLRTVPNIVGPI